MNNIFSDFNQVSKEDWELKIIADLKGKNPSQLINSDLIEELEFKSYVHKDDLDDFTESPGNFPYTRGMNTKNNEWNNGAFIEIVSDDTANKKALRSLKFGVDLLIFKSVNSNTNWSNVLANIQLDIIQSQFVVKSLEEYQLIKKVTLANKSTVSYSIDFLEESWSDDDFKEIAEDFKQNQQQFCSVNGFKIQRAGATTWQEIAFCLSAGHEYLLKLMHVGLNIDEAAACINFKIGIGENYFYEIAKFRVFRQLWSKIIRAYQPEHNCSYNCSITAISGLSNKSLKDPYTNLLRLTTEAMSAINGGIDSLILLPYDTFSTGGSTEIAERMAINISTILKEESYFALVNDAVGGSYSLENLTKLIGKKAWNYFQHLDALGGIFTKNGKMSINEQTKTKRLLRIKAYANKEKTLIGVNKFENPESNDNSWRQIRPYLGCDVLILENEIKMETV